MYNAKRNQAKCHHHHIALVAWVSLTLSCHSSLSFIALGRSSEQHPVSSHSCWMCVRVGRPAFARPCGGSIRVHLLWVRPWEEYYITIFIEVLYYLDYFRYNFMCEFVHVFLNMIFEQRNIHRFHKNMVSLLCVYACVVLNVNSSQKKTHTLHNHVVFLQYVFECVAPNMNCQQRKSHRFHINTVFLQCVYAYVVLSVNFSQKKTHTLYKHMVFPQYVYEYVVPNFHFD